MINNEKERVELHIHTKYSEMDGISSPTEIINRAAEWGYKAIAITDHGVVQGLPEAYKTAKKAGIKLILGMEGYLVDDEKYPDFMNMKISDFEHSHITILVKEDTSFDESIPKNERKYGRRNLYEIISHSHIKTFRNRPLIPKSLLEDKRDSLLVGSACQHSELYKAIVAEKSDEDIERIASFYDYIEIQPNSNIRINKKLIAIADKVRKPVVATGDMYYLKTTEEMLSDFSWAGDRAKEFVIDNPNKIVDMIMDDIPPIPKGKFYPYIENSDKELIEKCKSRAVELYGNSLPKYVEERLNTELELIIKHDYSTHFIIALRLVEESERNGYPVLSRGLTASSFISYLIGITDINPLVPHYYCANCKHSEFFFDSKYGSGFDLPIKKCPICDEIMNRDGHEIPFETFLGFHGEKEPDIVLTFSKEYQLRAHRYTEKLFGYEQVFSAGAVTNMGVKRKISHIPSKLVIIPDGYTVEDFTPIQYPANDVLKGVYSTHFDFKNSLYNTLLKLDELGHHILTLYKCLENLTGIRISDIDLCDPKLYELLISCKPLGVDSDDIGCETGTLALPKLGTPFVVEMLKATQPKNFADLLKFSGLLHGVDVWCNNAQNLLNQGICTVSDVIACREDIMLDLLHKCKDYEQKTGQKSPLTKKDCFDIMECVRKGNADKKLSAYEDAMKKVGIEQWYIDSCYKIKYMFPKVNVAEYAIAALRLAWYKLYYPIEFYSAYFTVNNESLDSVVFESKKAVKKKMYELNTKGFDRTYTEEHTYKALQIVMEMVSRGIEFLPIDLYKSDAKIYMIENEKIRLPFNAIEGVSENVGEAIIKARNDGNGEFISYEDLMARAGIGRSAIESLKQVGVLRDLPDNNQISLF